MREVLKVLKFILVFQLCIACSLRLDSNGQEPEEIRRADDQMSNRPGASTESPEPAFCTLTHDSTCPLRIMDARKRGQSASSHGSIQVLLLNESGNAVKRVKLGISPPPLCPEFVMIGDIVIEGSVSIGDGDEVIVEPRLRDRDISAKLG